MAKGKAEEEDRRKVMALNKRGGTWWYKFRFAKRVVRESSKSGSKTIAKEAEKKRRRELEEGFNNLGDARAERIQAVRDAVKTYFEGYSLRHRSVTFAKYALGHITKHLGETMLVDVTDRTVKAYQLARLKEGAAPKSVNEEVGFLLRLMGDAGQAIRVRMRRDRVLKLAVRQTTGKAFSQEEKNNLLAAARESKSPAIYPALMLALNAGMRDAEIRNLTWGQIDFSARFLTVGKSKSAAGAGRTIPLNSALAAALLDYARSYTRRFGTTKPGWYVFPFGKSTHLDPSKPVSTLKTAWRTARKKCGITGRWHDARHTLITELAESGAGDQTIMDIAGHVSRQMLARYSHIRMEAKRNALEGVGTSEPRATTDSDVPPVPAPRGSLPSTVQ